MPNSAHRNTRHNAEGKRLIAEAALHLDESSEVLREEDFSDVKLKRAIRKVKLCLQG